jgi:hypothetical protein
MKKKKKRIPAGKHKFHKTLNKKSVLLLIRFFFVSFR